MSLQEVSLNYLPMYLLWPIFILSADKTYLCFNAGFDAYLFNCIFYLNGVYQPTKFKSKLAQPFKKLVLQPGVFLVPMVGNQIPG